ncbi:MAG: hypothetical protein AAGK04_09410 [Planctomycetota bacterium]
MLDPQLQETLRSVVGPALAAAILFSLLWRPWRRVGGERQPMAPWPWLAGVTLGGAFVASWLIAQGFHGLWPVDTTRRIVWAPVLGIVVAGLAMASGRWRAIALPAVVLLGSFLLTWMLTEHRRQPGRWEGAWVAVWTAAWTLGVAGAWLGLVWTCVRRPGPLLPLVLSFAATALALVVTRAGVASLGQMGGVVSAWLGFVFLVALLNRSFTLAPVGAHVLAACLLSIVLLGYTTAPTPRPHTGLGVALLIPLIALPGALLWGSGERAVRGGRNRRLIRCLVADAIMLIVVGGGAVLLSAPPESESDEPDLESLYG